MSTEREKILEMLQSGRISAQEAAQLLDCLEPAQPLPAPSLDKMPNLQGKKLRVIVKGDAEELKNINVNVSVPLALARVVDTILENCIPNVAADELKKQGIDLRTFRIGDILSTLESLDEDLVNVDIDSEKAKMKVRVYVE